MIRCRFFGGLKVHLVREVEREVGGREGRI